MPVKPEVQPILAMIEAAEVPLTEQTPETVRQGFAALAAFFVRDEVASVSDRTIPGPGGDIPVRVYVPAGTAGGEALPVVVWFHGGGWVIGDIETADATVRTLANACDAVVVSVDYRLAPEHPFPAGLEDALAAVRWVADNAAELGADPSRLAVGGDSAGGNLSAVVCQQLRDTGPQIGFQLLVYPVTDLHLDSPSVDENAEGYFLTKETMLWFRGHYIGDDVARWDDPLVSPLRADDVALTGLPPALVITAEFDPLRDEGEAYGKRLQDAGVEATVTRYDGMIHGFYSMRDFIPDAVTAITESADALRKALA
jgi:acetyl esterase